MKRLFALLLAPLLPFCCLAQAPTRPPITGISHIAVYASKPDAAEHYYVHDIGLKKGADPENPAGVRYYVNAVQFIEVLPLPQGAGNSRLDHLAYNTADAEALRNYLAAQSIQVPGAIEKGADGSRWFFVHDPEGNKVEFIQPPLHPAAMTGSDPIGKHIIHVGMLVHSREA